MTLTPAEDRLVDAIADRVLAKLLPALTGKPVPVADLGHKPKSLRDAEALLRFESPKRQGRARHA